MKNFQVLGPGCPSCRHLASLYGCGNAVPAFVFAVLVAIGAKSVAAVFQKLSAVEVWARRLTGLVFILVGIYFCVTFIFRFSGS